VRGNQKGDLSQGKDLDVEQNHLLELELWLLAPHPHKHHNRVNQATDRAQKVAQETILRAVVKAARVVVIQEVDQVVQAVAQAATLVHPVVQKVKKLATMYQ
jgi:hypothetical protein